MTELHPSISAVGAHFDREVETATPAPQSQKEDSNLKRRTERERTSSTLTEQRTFRPADADSQIEEMMHLDQ